MPRFKSNRTRRCSRKPSQQRRPSTRLRFEPLEERRQLSANPFILGDATIERNSVTPADYYEVNGTTLFWVDDGIHGVELWGTDGTEAGTLLLKDINPGAMGSQDQFSASFVFDGHLYFSAAGARQSQLWKSDGTVEGTVRIADGYATQFTEYGGKLFFSSLTTGLWTTNGTPEGTTLVRDVWVENSGLVQADNGLMYFAVRDERNSAELWSSDGTSEGTNFVAEINPGITDTPIFQLNSLGSHIIFILDDGLHGEELWSFDTVEGSTKLIADIAFGPTSSVSRDLESIVVGGHLYFQANNGSTGAELWRTDGDSASIVKDIHRGFTGSSPDGFATLDGNTLIFGAYDDVHGFEVWKSDGTEAGTELVTDLNAGLSWANSPSSFQLVEHGGTLYFGAQATGGSIGVFRTDGTEAGTYLASGALAASALPSELASANGSLFFSMPGGEVWRSDGSAVGTELVATTNTVSRTTSAAVNGAVFFTGSDPAHGAELWFSDRTAAGTRLVHDIYAGSRGSYPEQLIAVDDALFFHATDAKYGREIRVSDGTAAGTYIIKDIRTGQLGSSRYIHSSHEGVVFFDATIPTYGSELWRTDGTAAGTWLVKDIFAGSGSGLTHASMPSGGFPFYFPADDGIHGVELWRSDGTADGTRLVADIAPGSNGGIPASSDPFGLLNFNGRAYFWASTGQGRPQVWTSDGTADGTIPLTEFSLWDPFGAPASSLVELDGLVYFATRRTGFGAGLWCTDGTAGGTRLVAEFVPGYNSVQNYNNLELFAVGDRLYFTAFTPEHGVELWSSNGTAAGTGLVKDLLPGPESSAPVNLTEVGGVLYFSAYDNDHGFELWTSDGTAAGTYVIDVLPGAASSSPSNLLNVAGSLFFTAADETKTIRPWLLPLNEAPTDLAVSNQTVNEHALTGTVVGTLAVNDPDAKDAHSFLLVDDAGGRFAVVGDQLIVADGSLLDFETATSHTITIEARDSGSLTFQKTLTIDLANKQERFFVTGADAGGGPHVRLLDGDTGAGLLDFFAYNAGFTGGVRVAMGDVNGDGMPDVITAAGPTGGPHVRVFDGGSGQQLSGAMGSFFAFNVGFTGGVSVASGDIDRDGHADVIVAADAGGGPHVRVFSGRDGSVLSEFFAFDAKFTGGVRVAVGDTNGDGRLDLIASMGAGDRPLVRIFTQQSDRVAFAEAATFSAYNEGFAGGVYVASGDFNGDRIDDIITGAGAGGGPHVRVFSGVDLAELASFFAFNTGFTGGVRVSAASLDDDLQSELLVAAGPGGGPHLRVLDADGERFSLFTYAAQFQGGLFVAGGSELPAAMTSTITQESASSTDDTNLNPAVQLTPLIHDQSADTLFADLDEQDLLEPESSVPSGSTYGDDWSSTTSDNALLLPEQDKEPMAAASPLEWQWSADRVLAEVVLLP